VKDEDLIGRWKQVIALIPFRFVHMADCHLDAPYATKNESIRKILLNAAYTSFRRAVALALAEGAHAFLIAGDLFDENYLSFRGETLLMEELGRLVDAGVQVVYGTGNHDYGGPDSKARSLPWPNIAIIDDAFQLVEVQSDGRLVGVVGGAGHNGPKVMENLAATFPKLSYSVPTVGLLHCQVASSLAPEEPYAPCTKGDLQNKGYDYWALGHIHKPQRVLEAPLAHYSGSLIGNNPKEEGPRGVLLVELTKDYGRVKFCPTAPVQWLRLTPDLRDVRSFEDLFRVLRGLVPKDAENLLVRVEFAGPSPLSKELGRMAGEPDQWLELGEEIRRETGALGVELKLGTLTGSLDPQEYKHAPHVLAEALSIYEELQQDPQRTLELLPVLAGEREGFVNEENKAQYLAQLLDNLDQDLALKMVKE